MKTKKFQKKLTLNKKTIADLSNRQLKKVYGGAYKPTLSRLPYICGDTECTCPTVLPGSNCGTADGCLGCQFEI